MELNPSEFDQVLENFHRSWNLERISIMTVQEYADLADRDSLCYWLEYGTKALGAIGNIRLQKFELWKPKVVEEFKDYRYLQAQGFAWNATKGTTLDEAFENIRSLILQIIEHSIHGNWQAIDSIPFHAIGKWKIAMLFSNKQLLPVYSRESLEAIGIGMGISFDRHTPTSELQLAILSLKKPTEDISDFSYRLYIKYAVAKLVRPSYFIIGSYYENMRSVITDFLNQNVVAMNWMGWIDFRNQMGKKRAEIKNFIAQHVQSNDQHFNDIQRYFWQLSKVKPGDIIAVKSKGSFNDLRIIAYAQVVVREGTIYSHDPNGLGHRIHVEFLDAGFVRKTHQNYAATIHHLPFVAAPNSAFQKIFGWYANLSSNGNPDLDDNDTPANAPEVDDTDLMGDYRDRNEEPFSRNPVASVIVNQVHSRLQNQFVKFLQSNYPEDKSTGEKKYIDVIRISESTIYFYEIKPDNSAKTCIRLGLGQLLDYAHKTRTSKIKQLVIVGQNEPDETSLQFIHQLRSWLSIPFTYIAFDEMANTAKEFPSH